MPEQAGTTIIIQGVYQASTDQKSLRGTQRIRWDSHLVDRLWPRGLTKQKAIVDLWLKDVAPSTELRKWFAHDPSKWAEFKKRYQAELCQNEHALSLLRDQCLKGKVTLLYGAKHNDAVVLKEYLENHR